MCLKNHILVQERMDMMSQSILSRVDVMSHVTNHPTQSGMDEKHLVRSNRCKNVTGWKLSQKMFRWADRWCGSNCRMVGSWVDGLSRHQSKTSPRQCGVLGQKDLTCTVWSIEPGSHLDSVENWARTSLQVDLVCQPPSNGYPVKLIQ